jgi:hypothetical protein
MNINIKLLNYLNNTTQDQYILMNKLCDIYKDKIIFGKKFTGPIYKKRYVGEIIFGITLTIKL